MKMSIAAKSRSGHVWMEIWLSASTSTPLTPPSGPKWWKWLCRIVAPAASAASRSDAVDQLGIGQVAGTPQIHQQMRAGKLHAVLFDEIVLLRLGAGLRVWISLGLSETIPSGLSASIAYPVPTSRQPVERAQAASVPWGQGGGTWGNGGLHARGSRCGGCDSCNLPGNPARAQCPGRNALGRRCLAADSYQSQPPHKARRGHDEDRAYPGRAEHDRRQRRQHILRRR